MGRIITPGEIHDGLTPSFNDFVYARGDVLDLAGPLVRSGDIVGLKIYGSVAQLALPAQQRTTQPPSVRSDLDVFVVTKTLEALHALRGIFEDIAQDRHVYIEAAIVNEERARSGDHLINPFLLRHMRSVPPGNVVGDDPSLVLTPQARRPEDIYRDYLRDKIESLLRNSVSPWQHNRTHALQRSLEAPVNVGRTTLDAYRYLFGDHPSDRNEGKAAVVLGMKQLFRVGKLVDLSDGLLQADRAYDEMLSRALEGDVSLEAYSRYVGNLERYCIPRAVSFVSGLDEHFVSLLEGSRHSIEGRPSGLERR
jgi:hypothetical protein